MAHLAATLGRFERALEIFESVAKGMVDNSLLKFSAKEYFLKAALCRLATKDVEGTKVPAPASVAPPNRPLTGGSWLQVYLDQYQNLSASFRDSREARLVSVRAPCFFFLLLSSFYLLPLLTLGCGCGAQELSTAVEEADVEAYTAVRRRRRVAKTTSFPPCL